MALVVPYGIQTYRRGDLPRVRLLNMYAESVPTSAAATALFTRPSLVSYNALGTGPVRSLYQQPGQFGGDLFTVSGSQLYRGDALLGDIAATGSVQFAAPDAALLMAPGDALWLYNNSLSQVAFPDGAQVSAVAYLGGYSFAARKNTRRLYFTADPTTWDGLDYVSAEQSTDPIIGLAVLVDQLLVFCERHTEVFYLTGDADAPIQRVQGRVFDKGARDRDTIVKFDNALVWVGHDGIVYRADNTPIRMSDHGIEEAIAASSTVSAWTYSWLGHLFYVLQLDNETLVYDVATKQWHEAGSYGYPRWRAGVGIQTGAQVLAGDDETGTVWRLADDTDEMIQRLFTVLLPDRGFADSLTLDCTKGKEDGLLEMRTSRDQGETWGAWRQCSLGKIGKYRKRVGFRRLGLIDEEGLVVQFRITDPVVSRVSSVLLNGEGAGRSC